MFSKGFIYLVLVVALYCKSKANSPGSEDNNSKSLVPGRKIVISGSHNEIRIANGQEELNRLKTHVKELQRSSQNTFVKLDTLNTVKTTINSMKAQYGNFSSYGPLIKKLQNQVNRLMTVFNSFGE